MSTPTPRAARWSRVSSAQQATNDREGLPFQHDEQDHAIALLNATDTGIEWVMTESGATVHETPEFRAMLASAGREWDVLIVAYVSRLGRKASEAIRAVEMIEAAGASVYFAMDRIATSDDQQWSAFAREAVEAESYRRKMSRDIRTAYESRWRRRGIPPARPPLGYSADWSLDPVSAELVKTLFTRYAQGNISIANLADQHGLEEERVKNILRNRTYLGEAGMRVTDEDNRRAPRHRRARQWRPGRHEAIISPELFELVAAARSTRQRAGGNVAHGHSMLSRRLFCKCGAAVRLDGRDRQQRARVRHLQPCALWGSAERKPAAYFEEPLQQALTEIRLAPEVIERIVNQPRTAIEPYPIRFRQERDALTRQLTSRLISGTEFDARMAEIDEDEHWYQHDQATVLRSNVDTDRLRQALTEWSALINSLRNQPYEAEGWKNLTDRYIARIEYAGPNSIFIAPSEEGQRAIIKETWPQHVTVGGERPRRESNPRRRP